MDYRKGDRVKHPTMEDWGLGEVLVDSDETSVDIFFVGVGKKRIVLEYVEPIKIPAEYASHPVLDNLKIDKSSSVIKYQSLGQSIQFFLKEFPEGFYGARYKEEERDYKEKAHQLAKELLNQEEFSQLLEQQDYAEITKRTLKIINSTNLIFPNEKMALKDGLVDSMSQEKFSISLYELLFGASDLNERFEGIANILSEINAAKWTTVSYFLFIFMPDKFMFVKPTVAKHASELCGFEINYKPQLNWLTYKAVMDFSDYLFSELSELKPRDMIDVQSFMWCIAPGRY